VFAGDNPLLALSDANTVESRFVHGLGPDGILASIAGGTNNYPVGDAAGTVRAVTDADGSVAATYRYDSFGNPAAGVTPSAPHAFHGFAPDPAGFYDARARTYDPATGRFLSEDPLPAVNLYPYALNTPLAANDPSGKAALVEYGHLQQNAARNSLTFCTQGSWTASLFMDVAVEVTLAAALGPLAGQGGLYSFWDAKANKPYVGRSVDLVRRINEHLAAGRIDLSKGIRFLTGVADDLLPAAEQLAINSCGTAGRGAAATLANKINAINKSRRDELARLKTTIDDLLGW
jgi:RHS repeat-associated protein